MALVVGVDCSTQATKVELRDAATGALVGSGRRGHRPTTPPRSEQHPNEWWEALMGAVEEAIAGRRYLADMVVGIAVAAQQHGMVALDGDRRVVRPAKLWNDTEPADDAAHLVESLGGAPRWAEACGSVPTAAFTIAKLAWLRRTEPDAFSRTAHVCLPHDWLTAMLTGELVTDRGDASGTGYWSAADGWRTDLLELVDPSRAWAEMLPRVLAPAEAAGTLAPSAAAALALPAGIPVAAGTGDNMAVALRLGLEPGDAAISVGTSGTVFAVTAKPSADPSGYVAGFADATGNFLPLVCTLNATKVTDAAARLLAVDYATLSATALSASPGAGGLVLVPYLDGERTPNRPDATGTLWGIRSDVTRAQLARAAFEGVACGLLDGLDALAAVGVEAPGRLFLVGGGARSPAYQRVMADLSGRVLTVADAADNAAAGACVQAAAVVAGEEPAELSRGWGPGSSFTVEPDEDVDGAAVRLAYGEARDR